MGRLLKPYYKGYRIYETISGWPGKPLSPYLKTLDEVRGWLLAQGYSRESVERFIETGWAPSGWIYPNGEIRDGISGITDGLPKKAS